MLTFIIFKFYFIIILIDFQIFMIFLFFLPFSFKNRKPLLCLEKQWTLTLKYYNVIKIYFYPILTATFSAKM